jgi:hypothetical protein
LSIKRVISQGPHQGGYSMVRYLYVLFFIALCSCGSSGGGSSGSTSLPPVNSNLNGGNGVTIGTPTTITLTANPSTLVTLGTSSITATVLDSSGANVPDGTIVRFSINSVTFGTITATATTVQGQAIATFTAANTPGTVIIAATAGTAQDTIEIPITAAAVGSIQYTSSSASVIGLQGFGQVETSTVTFTVEDVNGKPVSKATQVNFTMKGPGGGAYIAPLSASTNSAGQVSTILHSGSVSGPVTIIATVAGTSIASSSPTVSIGGGVPSATHFNLATTVFNIPGLVESNAQATISAFVADRFGNYDLLTGTSVSFYTEAGAIDRNNATNTQGTTSVTLRTQAPNPAIVAPLPWETTLVNRIQTTYGVNTGSHPRNGWCTVLATVMGEEAFSDVNGTGVYVLGDPFVDLGDPFIDKNDDTCRNDGTTKNCDNVISPSTDPFEEFIDANGDGKYDGPNGVWDGPNCPAPGCLPSKMIWTDITLAFTGNAICAISPKTFSVGAPQTFSFMVGDVNLNPLIAGTTIKVAATTSSTIGFALGGTIAPLPLLDFVPNANVPSGPTEISFSLQESPSSQCSKCDVSNPAFVTVTVTPPPPVAGCILTIAGSLQSDSSLPTLTVLPATALVGPSYPTTAQFTITGGTAPYTVTSSCAKTVTFNDNGAGGGIAGNEILDGGETNAWNLNAAGNFVVTFPLGANTEFISVACTLTVQDHAGNQTLANLTVLEQKTTLSITPKAVTVVPPYPVRETFTIAGGTAPYTVNSSCPAAEAFNDNGAGGGIAGNGILDGEETAAWSLSTAGNFVVTVPNGSGVAGGTPCTLTVNDFAGNNATAILTIPQ